MKLISPGAAAFARLVLIAVAAQSGNAYASNFTGHQFSVSESGAATVTVPIQVPRGIGGMEPQLSLNYSSQNGNGLFGLGWTLIGPSSITRCPKTKAVDSERGSVDFTAANDRFCLDGQRLLLVSGAAYGASSSQYVTERDSFSVITALGTHESQTNVPASFRVETKAGLIMEFGLDYNTGAHSRVPTKMTAEAIAAGRSDTVNRWMLQRIADLHGSFVEFTYCPGEVSEDGGVCAVGDKWFGSAVLHHIRYTNRNNTLNGQFGVLLRYEDRPDKVRSYHAGAVARQSQRVKAIETYVDFTGPAVSARGSLVRRYEMTYGPLHSPDGMTSVRATNSSRLEKIQEFDAEGNSLPPLQFTIAPDVLFGGQVTGHKAYSSTTTLPPRYPCGGPGRMCP